MLMPASLKNARSSALDSESTSMAPRKPKETPEQRAARLQRENNELKADMTKLQMRIVALEKRIELAKILKGHEPTGNKKRI